MIIALGDRAFEGGWTLPFQSALQITLAAHQLGHLALVVTPAALSLALASAMPDHLKENLSLVHKSWLESQGLMKRATRIVELTSIPEEHGKIDGKKFHVLHSNIEVLGLHREPTFVVESLGADAKYVRLLMKTALDFNAAELRRFWGARPEPGGGGNIHTYVQRYADEPSPMFILCDRDGAEIGTCGPTGQKCAEALVNLGYFGDFERAMEGGYSSVVPNLGFRVFGAHEMENLVLPRVAAMLCDKILAEDLGDQRRSVFAELFPGFPELSFGDAERWLATDFKKIDGYGKLLSSASLNEISDWTSESEENFDYFYNAVHEDLRNPIFFLPIIDTLRDVWTIGARNRTLL